MSKKKRRKSYPPGFKDKSRIGDWEIDTVIGKNHKQALVTIVERKIKFTVMKNLGTGRAM